MNGYLWIKSLHIIADMAWMAGMLYLPRLFVYHAQAAAGSAQAETFKVMERKLMRYIMTPAMIVAILTGLTLAWQAGFLKQGWLHGKLLMVFGMSALHGFFAHLNQRFAQDQNRHGPRFFRFLNEVPTVLLVFIVILVVVKPF